MRPAWLDRDTEAVEVAAGAELIQMIPGQEADDAVPIVQPLVHGAETITVRVPHGHYLIRSVGENDAVRWQRQDVPLRLSLSLPAHPQLIAGLYVHMIRGSLTPECVASTVPRREGISVRNESAASPARRANTDAAIARAYYTLPASSRGERVAEIR